MALTVVSGNGRAWRLTEQIGSGSEGFVYGVEDTRPLVAKLVPDPPDPEAFRRRVARLVRQRREPRTVELLSGTPVRLSWPLVPVRTAGGGPERVDGYVMTDMRHAYQPFSHLLDPHARRAHLPAATWATALCAALALARLLARVHAEGYVVGDLKPDNLWVDETGRIGMADVDSWQFTDGRDTFAGRMRTPGYTAPERIAAPAGAPPDSASDDFALAVLVHQLLVAGLHPFAGHPAGGGCLRDYTSYDDNVVHGRCRLLDRTSVLLPRSAPPADLLPRPLAEGFRAAFAPAGRRPTAAGWARSLAAELAPGRLKVCAVNARHVHTVERPWCPWCDQAGQGFDSYPDDPREDA
ncbi:protein kinase domain-containing protein [Streptomyces synnematoformans]|uniref:protein kinase domain-containing protein n=1 Tax=Streptomyces synnematoformans TaxID=415721 RepID=UPI0031CECE89